MITVLRIIQDLEHIGIPEVDVFLLAFTAIFTGSVNTSSTGKSSELHDVASECASFVGEDVFDLAELLVQVGRLAPHAHHHFLVEHQEVGRHEHSLPEFNQLKGHNQRNRHKVDEHKNPRADELDEKLRLRKTGLTVNAPKQPFNIVIGAGCLRGSDDGCERG